MSKSKILYTSEDVADLGVAPPGEFPYTRGVHAEMYTKKLWTMRQYAGFGDAAASNKRYHYLLSQGVTGLSIAFDLPTQMGYDSDDKLAKGEVGRVGVAISSLEDMHLVLKDLPLEKISCSMTINATAPILLGLYLIVAEQRQVDWKKLRGTIQNDVLKEYIARGTYIFPPKASLKIASDVFEFCKDKVPQWNTISISGYHIREAGSTAVQEVAFTLANGLAYMQAAVDRGLKVDDFAPRLSFFFNVHNQFLEEVAKFRAARKLWATLVQKRFSPKDPRSTKLRFHAQTAGSSLIAQQVDTNVVRVTMQCLAAVLGGAQSIHTNSRDEAVGLPTEAAATLALRTQQVIAHESGVNQIVDPMGGSYSIEALTEQIFAESAELIEKIESRGGVVACIEEGFQQNLIQKSAYEYQLAIENKSQIVVGLNEFVEEKETRVPVFAIDPKIEENQVARLQAFRKGRKKEATTQALVALKRTAQQEGNLMPPLLDSIRSGATVGEMIATLVEVYSRYTP